VAKAYGVAGDRGMCKRWTFFIGPDGKILHIDKQVSLLGHGQSVAETLARLGAPRRPQESTPDEPEGANPSDV
jgi:peroxiredoxin Q/BCP